MFKRLKKTEIRDKNGYYLVVCAQVLYMNTKIIIAIDSNNYDNKNRLLSARKTVG